MTVDEAPLKGQIQPHRSVVTLERKFLYGFLAFLVVAIVVAVPVTVTQFAVHRRNTRGINSSGGGSKILAEDYCNRLQGDPQRYCLAYLKAKGPNKFSAASVWLQANQTTHVCAGIDVVCLNEDISSEAEGSSCRALDEGAFCAAGLHCCQGVCGGGTPETLVPLPRPTVNGTAAGNATEPEPEQLRIPFIPGAPNASWPTAYAAIWPSNKGLQIPQGFLATSHEWKRMTDYGGENVQAFANIFKMLAAKPVLRIGGSSQDLMTELPGPEIWTALKRLQQATNCRFIIGLPLHQKNATAMSRQIMITAKKELGPALMGFELGNEPEFWLKTGLGGWTEEGNWVPGFEGYAPYFHRVASVLNPCDDNEPQLSGPGWGNVNTQDPSWFREVASKGKCYLKEVNTHYYPYINNETVTAPELLSQWLQDFALEKFKVYAKVAHDNNLQIRISETNSLYSGGRVGLSDTMTGAFWVADALFAFANAGARAFHLHWGKGGDLNGDSQPNTGVQTNFEKPEGKPPLPWPSVHAPWYGYLFWVAVTAGEYGHDADSSFVAANVDRWENCTANIKLWAVKSKNEELRIAILNKDVEKSCNMELKLEASHCKSKANLSRMLPGTNGIFTKAGVTMRGQHYMEAGITGKIQGQRESEELAPIPLPDGSCKLVVSVPQITGTILVVPGVSRSVVTEAAASQAATTSTGTVG